MPKIRVLGNGYKSAFESAKAIISAGMLDDEISTCFVDNENCIHNGPNVFEFVEGNSLGDKLSESDFRIEKDGASWFSSIRKIAKGKASAAETSDAHLWEEFIADISRKYHDKYFLVSCHKRNSSRSADENDEIFERYNLYASNIMNFFYPQITDWEFYEVTDNENFDDIYGLNLRLQIGTGGEKEVPVLGTLYFKKHGNHRMIPLAAEDAICIEKNLEISGDSTSTLPYTPDIDETNNTLNTLFSELTRIISEDIAGTHLVDCLHYDEDDAQAIQGLLSRIQNDNKMLVCKQVEVLGVSHVNWEKRSYIISNKRTGEDAFSIVGGIDGKVVMSCLGCTTPTDLILNNRITFTNAEDNTSVSMTIDPGQPDLGLTPEMAEMVNASDLFSSHHLLIGALCGTPREKKPCSKIRCKSTLVELETPRGVASFCRDCPYPEVVYTDHEGDSHYTPTLRLDTETMRLVLPTEVAETPCHFCGRTVATLKGDKYCQLCSTVHNPDEASRRVASDRYEKYKTILPLHVRMAKGTKRCYEDAELLIFVVGGKKLIFHKFWLDSKGYVRSPEYRR